MFNFDTETTASVTATTSCWPFAVPEPPQPPTDLDLFASTRFSPPPFFSSLYNLPITPERPERPLSSTAETPSSWIPQSHSGLFHFPHPSPPDTTAMIEESITAPLPPLPLTTPTFTVSHPPTAAPSPNSSTHANIMAHPSSPSHSSFSETLHDRSSPSPDPIPPLDDSTLPTTHAARNPHLPIQQSRTHQKLSTAQRATRALQAQATKDKRSLLMTAIQELQEKHQKEFDALARTHCVTGEYVQKIVSTPQFKAKRGVSIQNAKIHAKAVEVNADLGVGERIKLSEIKQLVKDDPLLQDLSAEQEEILRQSVRELRDHKKLGPRLSNQATAQVFRHGFGVVTDLINSISSRTGACVLTIWSRSNLDDIYEPCWMVSDNASTFVPDVLGKSMWDLTRLLEQWACSKAGASNPDTLASMRTECSMTITGTLKMVTGSKVADMNYDNYDEKIVQRLKVKLVGWPFEKIVSPAKLYTVSELRTLRDTLRSGACCWVRLTKQELKVLANETTTRREAGEVIGKTRKARSDKGVKTGPRPKPGAGDESSDSEGNDDDGLDSVQRPRKRKSAQVDGAQAGLSKKRKPDQQAGPSKKRKADQQAGPSKKKRVRAKAGRNSAKAQLPPSKEILTDTDESHETDREDE